MKHFSTKNALLITASLGYLSRLALAAPVIQITEGTSIGRNSTLVSADQEDQAKIVPRWGIDPIIPEPHIPEPDIPVVERPPGTEPGPVVPRPSVPEHPEPHPNPPAPHADWEPIPAKTNPGQGQGKGDDPKSIEEYEEKGKKVMENYEEVVKSDKPDTLIVQTEAELKDHDDKKAFLNFHKHGGYKTNNDNEVEFRSFKSLQNFKSSEIGFDIAPETKVTRVTVADKNDDKNNVIIISSYDPKGDFIVFQSAFKKGNNEIPGHVPLNEMNMQNFIKVAGHNTKNVRAAFIENIMNKGFFDITRQNYNDMKQPFDKMLTFNRGTPQFDRFMGSEIIWSKVVSFTNHHNAIGNKIIEKIVVVPKQAKNSDEELAVAIVFKDA